jgi:hypothetical protein
MNEITTSHPWWRYPMVWMVIAGPAMVVVAGVVTMFLALSSPDPVLDTRTQNLTQAPAVQARNHAAAGSLPGKP